MTVNAVMGEAQAGHYATSRRGSLDDYERAFIEQKVAAGLSDFTIAQMLQRPRDMVAWYREALAIERAERPSFDSGCLPVRPRLAIPKAPLEIMETVAWRHGVTVADLRGRRRSVRFVHARQEAMALIYETGRFSYPQVGKMFDRDHSTAVHGVNAHWQRIHKQQSCVDGAQRTTREPESDSKNGGSI